MRSRIPRVAPQLLILFGFFALAYAGGEWVYREISQRLQSWKFEQTLDGQELMKADATARPIDIWRGDLVGKLEILRIGLSVMVLHGVEPDVLRVAAGHVPATPQPGAGGNSAIAAHRDTLFRGLEGIRSGDRIRISTIRGTYDYVVESTEVVQPEDTRVLESRARSELTLITCYPFQFIGPAPERFIVHALLVSGS